MNNILPAKKILIADDDLAILDAFKIILEQENYEVSILEDQKSLKEIYQNPPDLILLDIWMQGLNGGELCKNLKSTKETKNIPIILVSANRDTKKIAHESGADDYLEKPFSMEEFLKKIREHTE